VYYEAFGEILATIAREQEVKSWSGKKKIALIDAVNRDWKDLSANWYGARGGAAAA
jgi:putative endonuclease